VLNSSKKKMDVEEMQELERYKKQIIFEELGEHGQKQLFHSRALIVGCGGLGGYIAQYLTRAGVGHLILLDGDTPDLSNLHRQILFTEEDVKNKVPKALAAKKYLSNVNSQIQIDAHVMVATKKNLEPLLNKVDVILDASDNFDIRYAINELSIQYSIPWIYGGVIGSSGITMTIVPGITPCLCCIFPDKPVPGTFPTSDTKGIVAQAPGLVASIQSLEAMKILSGQTEKIRRSIIHFDLWDGVFLTMGQNEAPVSSCSACGHLSIQQG